MATVASSPCCDWERVVIIDGNVTYPNIVLCEAHRELFDAAHTHSRQQGRPLSWLEARLLVALQGVPELAT